MVNPPTSGAPSPEGHPDPIDAWCAAAFVPTEVEDLFGALARLAASICDTATAGVCLVGGRGDRVTAEAGLPVADVSGVVSFCRHALLGAGVLIVPDAAAEARFNRHPLVVGPAGVRFWAGAPLVSSTGPGLGAIWVMDWRARGLSGAQVDGLVALARQAVAVMDLRTQLAEAEDHLGRAEASLRQKEAIIEVLEAHRAWAAPARS